MFTQTPALYPSDLATLKEMVTNLSTLGHWAGVSLFSIHTIALIRYRRRMQSRVNRIFLKEGGQMAIIIFNDGSITEWPVSALS